MEIFMKGFGQESDWFHVPADYEISGIMNITKAFCGKFMMKLFHKLLHFRLFFPEI